MTMMSFLLLCFGWLAMGQWGMGPGPGVKGYAAAGLTITKIGSMTDLQTTPVITLTGGCAVDAMVFVAGSLQINATPSITLADNATGGSNTYSSATVGLNASQTVAAIKWHAVVTHALATNNTITFSGGSYGAWNLLIYCVTGLSTSPVDQAAGDASGYNSSCISPSITPSVSPTVAFGVLASDQTFSAAGNIIGSASTLLDNQAYGSGRDLLVEYRELSATTAGTAAATYTGSAQGGAVIANYKKP